MVRFTVLCTLLAVAATAAAEAPPEAVPPTPAPARPADAPLTDEEIQKLIEEAEKNGYKTDVIVVKDRIAPGSTHVIDAKALERFERDDIHKVLSAVPGVYIRQEDGYGLRPNIGMRGAAAERSAKVALMEDGILIAPAPYSAPAAYYFPVMTRLVAVEVTKGPGAIAYGPNTVGGAVNVSTRDIPRDPQATIDLAGGSDLYGKAHATVGMMHEDRFGFLIEAVKLRSDGFKQLDGGGDTGFDKNDVHGKARVRFGVGEKVTHDLTAKAVFSTEVSDETYTGLTDADFAATPYRRYLGTKLDRFDSQALQLQLSHRADFGGVAAVTTTAYRHTLSRDWRKLDNFAGAGLADVLANPTQGNNAIFYAVLTGAVDSTTPEESLLIGTNERDFVSQGAQVVLTATPGWFGLAHELEAGLRYHEDSVERFHHEDGYRVAGGDLVSDGTMRIVTRDGVGSARALATYLRERVTAGPISVTAGLRAEIVRTRATEVLGMGSDVSDTYSVLIPGIGLVYRPIEELGLLAGVHKGFVPVSPGETDASPEESINYEVGARWGSPAVYAETIGFLSDYSNLKGTCTLSTGCDPMSVDDEFDGGAVLVYGLEAQVGAELRPGAFRVPLQLTYTLSRSRFQHAFESDNPEWGEVDVGDELPYLPVHQLSAQAGLRRGGLEVNLAGRYTSPMRDQAGQGEIPDGTGTDAQLVLDLAASYHAGKWGEAYLTVDNVLDEAAIVARRPYGARPGVPRLVIVGYKKSF